MRNGFYFLLAALLLSGCAGRISDTTCQTKDWRALGFRDASRGLLSRLKDIQAACPAYPVDGNEYRLGFDEGLDEFCSLDRAFEFGMRGGDYQGQCPGAMHRLFLRGYEAGQLVGHLQRQVQDLDERIRDVEMQLDRPGLNQQQYYYLKGTLRELYRERQDLERQLARLRRF
ncbi:MAG: DUF2799 domain-containing protein [Gammaproteobacteria bacterium]|nr:DUF2799 domain-containing protein [Gammaproteobacteria bacterium]